MKNLKKSVSVMTVAGMFSLALAPIKNAEADKTQSFLSSNNMMCSVDLENTLLKNNINIDNKETNNLLANTAENSDIAVEIFDKKMYATTTVNIRREANKKSNIVDKLKFRQKIMVSENTKKSTKWVRIIYKNKVAYVYGKYLSSKKPKKNKYSESDLSLLAHLIYAECGSSWCSDKMLYYAGSVVLNRVKSDRFPNSIHDVIYAHGQYAPTWNGAINKTPDKRAWRIAKDLIVNGSVLPENVVFQAEFTQGSGVYEKVQNEYFCKY